MASEADFEPDRRLHPLSWMFVLLASLKQFIVPLVAVLLFGARDDGSAWGALFVIPLVIAAVWRQWLYRYGFGPRGLVIRDGLLFRNVRQIEYERIENIDTQRGVLHRLLNVAEVRLESSTGGKPEASIRVLGLAAVQELRDRVFGTSQPASAAAPSARPVVQEQTLLQLSPAELMRYGFVDNRGMLIVAAVFGVVSQTGVMSGLGDLVQPDTVEQAARLVGFTLALVGLGLFVTLFLFVRFLSLLWALVALHDFTVTRQGADLRIRYGLLTRIALTLRLPRIQAVHRTESVMHRFFGRVSLSVDLAGDGGPQMNEDGTPQTRMRWLAPICAPRRATELMRIALPMLVGDSEPQWQPLAPGARARIFRKVVTISTLICAIPGVYWLGAGAPLLWLGIVPLAWLHATQYVRRTRWALTREALFYQRGWLTRRLTIVPRSRIQVADILTSPFDRRRQMATLVVDTAGASGIAGVARIPYLPADAARSTADALYMSARELQVRRNTAPTPALG